MSKMPPAMKYFLVPFYGTYLKLRYGLETKGFEALRDLDGPAVVFANHVHTLDPFFISARFPIHIRWVAGAYLFKMKVPSFLLRHWVQAIPKAQGKSDIETIRNISDALKHGDVVGLFPEGTRTWDGKMMDITTATAKIVRLFKVPTVFINIEGGFSKKPRWSHTERKGKVYLTVKKILYPDEIKASSISDLVEIVSENLTFDNTLWQKENGIEYYDAKKQADGIERLMYACTCCGSFETMHSEGDAVRCSECGREYKVDGYFNLVSGDDSLSLADYHERERRLLGPLAMTEREKEIFPVGDGILLQTGGKKRNVLLSKDFKLHCYADRMEIRTKEGEDYLMPFADIDSMIICAKYTIELYLKGRLFRIRLKDRESTLKYQDYYFELLKHGNDN